METLLGGPSIKCHSKQSGKHINRFIKGIFERCWLDKLNEVRIGPDGFDHNKLRTLKSFKSSFTTEPYLTLVRNRNQRMFLSGFRLSASNLDVERLRYTNVPFSSWTCKFRSHLFEDNDSKPIDDERHFFKCEIFTDKINCLILKMTTLLPAFIYMTEEEKFLTLMCPTSPQSAKIINKFIKIVFEARDKVLDGHKQN